MMRSLYSAVTGLRAHVTKMDVIGNNIANVNTVGFKGSRMLFQDIYSQTISPASASTATRGGTNPQQIGLGVQTSTIDVLNTAASSQYTGSTLDLAIDGTGYFVISGSGGTTYTRAGNFYTDKDNYLVDSNGNYVQGYKVDTGGNLILNASGNPQMENIFVDPGYYDISISSNGQVVGLNTATSASGVVGQIVLAAFANPNGLEKTGENTFRTTVNSGNPTYNTPTIGGMGSLNPGSLEMSNVDLTSQFADMIVTQRGFQANSRVITATDQMLQEIVNMVRQ